KTLTATWRKAETGVEALQSAYAILNQISRELKSSVYANPNDKLYLLGIDAGGAHISQTASDEIYFVASVAGSGGTDLCEVGYWLRDTGVGKDDSLMRHIKTDTSGTINFTTSVMLSTSQKAAANVTKFEVLFWDTATASWSSGAALSWDSRTDNKLPVAVKIKLGIADAKKTFEKEFEKVVFLQASQRE
ncbi:MAG: hypothetical protein Q8R48_00640, partial [Candidatus Omnitrophota bacterium]|nr:hypothetical protein [Candidatus Omnitrophota bacterium]